MLNYKLRLAWSSFINLAIMIKNNFKHKKDVEKNSLHLFYILSFLYCTNLITVIGIYQTATNSRHIRINPPIIAPITMLNNAIQNPTPLLPIITGQRNIYLMPNGIPQNMNR